MGVHNFQILRANKTQPPEDDRSGNAYNHAPMLSYWRDTWFVQYLASEWHEHGKPTQAYVATSLDGRDWTGPRLAFPAIEYEPGKFTISHQRMGFYVAPNGRLLTLAFYGIPTGAPDSPNAGNGIGRAVREIFADGSFGPIHFIRAMPHAGHPESVAARWHPFYTNSPDAGFREACEALLRDRLMTLQWWEEDRASDGFFAIDPKAYPGFSYKALSYYRRPDGVVVGLWKDAWASLTSDEGRTWSAPVQITSKPTSTAKEWGQRTPDGRYLIAYNPMPNKSFYRYPLAVVSSDDGVHFDDMLVVQTEVPALRFNGYNKDRGSNYVRGVMPGNGEVPGDRVPLVYSMNKEDLWISHVPTPLAGRVTARVRDTFDTPASLDPWNLYVPRLTTLGVHAETGGGSALRFTDRDPHDYAKAVRVFPETERAEISFRLNIRDLKLGRFEIDVCDARGERPVRLQFDGAFNQFFASDGADLPWLTPRFKTGEWREIRLVIDARSGRYDLLVDGEPRLTGARFYQDVHTVERIELRTGFYRRETQHEHIHRSEGAPFFARPDAPVHEIEVLIDHLVID